MWCAPTYYSFIWSRPDQAQHFDQFKQYFSTRSKFDAFLEYWARKAWPQGQQEWQVSEYLQARSILHRDSVLPLLPPHSNNDIRGYIGIIFKWTLFLFTCMHQPWPRQYRQENSSSTGSIAPISIRSCGLLPTKDSHYCRVIKSDKCTTEKGTFDCHVNKPKEWCPKLYLEQGIHINLPRKRALTLDKHYFNV